MEFKTLIDRRRSVRRFTSQRVPHTLLQDIVQATLTAPSSRNTHSTRLMVVEDAPTVARMAEMRDYGSSFMTSAQAAILVMGDTSCSDLWEVNCAISATMLQLAVVDAGLASCWVHVADRPRRKDEPEGEKAEEYLRSFLDIPATCKVECIIAIGYADHEPKPLPEWDSAATVMWHKAEE